MELAGLIAGFHAWRAVTRPDSADDVPRVDRPAGWLPDWSAAAVAQRRARVAGFAQQAAAIGPTTTAEQVDARLLRVGLDQVRWELDHLAPWRHDPDFYLDQALGHLYVLLLAPPPLDVAAVTALLRHVPEVLDQARTNLAGHAATTRIAAARTRLAFTGERLTRAMAALADAPPTRGTAGRAALAAATGEAVRALAGFDHWLTGQSGVAAVPVGAAGLAHRLHRVALLPYSPDELRAQARSQARWARALEAVHSGLPRDRRATGPVSAAGLVERADHQERAVRRFYATHHLVDLPADLRRYRFAVMPAYLEPLTWLGVPHHIGSPDRPDEDAVRYVRAPRPDLPYFQWAKVLDPRTGIVHEGVHAHQLALSWRHPDPARRHVYDTTSNEGLAFHHEELMLHCGLFVDAPASAAFLANSMVLRAVRVEVDLGLALGELTVDQAADRLATEVPLDRATAVEEATFFAANPGQGLSYLAGKLQILDLLAAAGREPGFDRRAVLTRLWLDGNVPLALHRWETLGRPDHLAAADRLAG